MVFIIKVCNGERIGWVNLPARRAYGHRLAEDWDGGDQPWHVGGVSGCAKLERQTEQTYPTSTTCL